MRLLPAVAVALPLLSTVTMTAAPASAAAPSPTCQGKPATIVGAPGQEVRGTPGDDVIVASGDVRAGGGDDLVCTTGTTTYAGAGDDVVVIVRSKAGRRQEAVLGPGDDTFVGGAGDDLVNITLDEFAVPVTHLDPGADRIFTRGGDDKVFAGSPKKQRHREVVRLGRGADRLSMQPGGWATGSKIGGGPGTDVLEVSSEDLRVRNFSLLLDQRRVVVGGRRVVDGWSGFDVHQVGGFRVRIDGSAGPDVVHASWAERWDVKLGGGDDVLLKDEVTRSTGVLDLGAGRDLVQLTTQLERWLVDLDLTAGFLQMPQSSENRTRLRGVDDLVVASVADVTGNELSNAVTVGCGTVDGGDGPDRLTATSAVGESTCATFDGGAGDDVLVGGPGNDVLTGGDGTDSADGRAGTDRCDAETEVRCEL